MWDCGERLTELLWFWEKDNGLVWRNRSICCSPKSKEVFERCGLLKSGPSGQSSLANSQKSGFIANFFYFLGKYCWRPQFLDATAPSNASGEALCWERSCWKCLIWWIGDVTKISVFKDKWIPNVDNPYGGRGVQRFWGMRSFALICGVKVGV